MLGSDPISALLGAGIDPRAPQVVWKAYLRKLVAAGAAVCMMAPDVVVPDSAEDADLSALAALLAAFPMGTQMPPDETGKLANAGMVDAEAERVNLRVAAYFRRIAKVAGKDRLPGLLECGAVTASAGIHVGGSRMVAVIAPDAAGLQQWRDWAAQTSGDPLERHTAPTVLLPTAPGGGVYLFRCAAGEQIAARTLNVGVAVVESGNLVVPVPPTRQSGAPVTRLGPCRMLPDWLRDALLRYGQPPVSVAELADAS